MPIESPIGIQSNFDIGRFESFQKFLKNYCKYWKKKSENLGVGILLWYINVKSDDQRSNMIIYMAELGFRIWPITILI